MKIFRRLKKWRNIMALLQCQRNLWKARTLSEQIWRASISSTAVSQQRFISSLLKCITSQKRNRCGMLRAVHCRCSVPHRKLYPEFCDQNKLGGNRKLEATKLRYRYICRHLSHACCGKPFKVLQVVVSWFEQGVHNRPIF